MESFRSEFRPENRRRHAHGVPPMQLTESKEVLCGILKGVTCIELGTIDGYELDWEESIPNTVFPVLQPRGDFSLDSKKRDRVKI